MTSDEIILSAASLVGGAIIAVVYDLIKEKHKFRKEFENNNSIDLSGDDWVAAWQTSVDHKENCNTEKLKMRQRGGVVQVINASVSPENPKGGYLWKGQLQFFQGRDLMGWYFAEKEENSTSKGMIYLTYNAPHKLFVGKWVGCSYDGPLVSGFVVISKSRETSFSRLSELITKHPHTNPIITYTM